MDFEEKTLKRTEIFDGHVIKVVVDDVELPNNLGQAKRELIFHRGAVAVLAITDEDKIILVKQYRKAIEKVSYEIPAGKLEIGENGSEKDAAARELEEETGISKNDIILTSLMNFEYKLQDMELEVYVGKLNKEVKLVEEINKLFWIDKNDNFFDVEKYAGEGNIGHMLRQVEIYKDEIFK